MIRNVTVNDLALIELLGGKTDAPEHVLAALRRGGFVNMTSGGGPTLTASGRKRARALKPMEQTLRAMHTQPVTGQNRPVICAVPGPSVLRT